MSERFSLPWIKDEVTPQGRKWEEFYRNRWQHDKIVRSTHGVNCTGGCTWQIHVKDGTVTWEMQGLDYPSLQNGLPPYEPRDCQRGIYLSWYLYSPLRVKYPYVRGALLDLWKQARAQHADPVNAWKSMVENPEARQRWQRARGKGGFRRLDWDTALEIMAAANWGKEKGKWNLRLKDSMDGSDIDPVLTFLGDCDEVVQVRLDEFAEGKTVERGVPIRRLQTIAGETVLVTTIYDLLMAHYGVPRGLEGGYPPSYDDEAAPYTPAWSEKYIGMKRDLLIRFAREWGGTVRHP